MKMRLQALKNYVCAAALAAAPLGLSSVSAATPAEVTPGMQVADPSGGTVGTVTGIKGDNLVLKTVKHEVLLPMSAFTADKGKLLFAMTAAQLDAQADQQAAAASQAVAAGAPVFGSDGTPAGTIESIDGDKVTIKLASGVSIQVQRSGLAPDDQGVVIGLTTAKLNEMASQGSAPAGTPEPQAQ
jgi:hypothetical protein